MAAHVASERADAMGRLSALLMGRSEEIATTITQEMGSPIGFPNSARPWPPTWSSTTSRTSSRSFPFEEVRPGMMGPCLVRNEGVGVVAAIPPWNVPQFTIMSKLVPALLAGCTIVIKPAPETPLDPT